jgi:hypothetical protein
MEQLLETLQHIFSMETVILLLVLIAFGDKAKASLMSIYAFITGKTRQSDLLEKFQVKSKKLSYILDIYRERYNAGRISFFTFHNGGHDFQGVPFIKFSCIDEVTCKGVLSKMSEFQNYHLCIIIDWLEQFILNNSFLIETEKISNNSVYTMLLDRKCHKCVLSPVWNGRNLAGFIMVEWLNSKFVPENINEILDEIEQLSKTVEIERFK